GALYVDPLTAPRAAPHVPAHTSLPRETPHDLAARRIAGELRRDDVEEETTHHLVTAPAEDALRGVVPRVDPPLRVEPDDGVVEVLEEHRLVSRHAGCGARGCVVRGDELVCLEGAHVVAPLTTASASKGDRRKTRRAPPRVAGRSPPRASRRAPGSYG